MASAQLERPREENVKWREAVVKIDSDTFMRVQYLFGVEVNDYQMLASLVRGGYDFGRAWVVNARGVTAENASSQDWRAYTSGSRAAAHLLEESGESGIISKRDDVGRATHAQKERFNAFMDMTEASIEVARNPGDLDAFKRLEDATRRFRHTGRAEGGEERTREEVAPAHAEEAAPAEAPAPKGTFSKEAEAALSETAEATKGITAGKAASFEFFTPDDPRGISYGFEIHWKDGYVPRGEYDRSDIWSTERFLFANLEGIEYYGVTGFIGGRLDNSAGVRQFSGDSFAVEYMRRAFLRLEDEIGGDTVRIYVPRGLDVSGKTLADLINSPDVVAMSVVEEGGEKFIWDIYAKEQRDLLAALQTRFPEMEFVLA
ncbi:MAG: hypothetical protein WC350_03475 [Candidatus Micrarchaeia archaeon]|jgi:hypothetical protein